MSQPIWETPAGTLGSFSSVLPLTIKITAAPVYPALLLTYKLLNGQLPAGFIITTVNNSCFVLAIFIIIKFLDLLLCKQR